MPTPFETSVHDSARPSRKAPRKWGNPAHCSSSGRRFPELYIRHPTLIGPQTATHPDIRYMLRTPPQIGIDLTTSVRRSPPKADLEQAEGRCRSGGEVLRS